MATWEVLAPRRVLKTSKLVRWVSNLGLVFINTASLRLILPILAIDIALKAEANGWGLLNNYHLPTWVSFVLGVLILDLIIYLQHLMFHTVPFFWQLHMMHHADLDIDVTTGLRFHPIEIFMSMGIKIAAVAAFGTPVLSVLVFEILLNGTAMFNHSNAKLPLNIDRILRLFVITPDMHRVHHSVTIRETNSNFGFNFPWWDRLLGTYRAQPAAGHEGMTIGLSQFRNEKRLTLPWMLALPFIGDPGFYAINRRGREPVIKK
ncbi:MAG: sterol desaturase family protein [Nitrospiraceae bacterium]|nr:MAG: sterol desaturase family protein [Nitrospiraceae bacterium]